jgi:hypothetical protein
MGTSGEVKGGQLENGKSTVRMGAEGGGGGVEKMQCDNGTKVWWG